MGACSEREGGLMLPVFTVTPPVCGMAGREKVALLLLTEGFTCTPASVGGVREGMVGGAGGACECGRVPRETTAGPAARPGVFTLGGGGRDTEGGGGRVKVGAAGSSSSRSMCGATAAAAFPKPKPSPKPNPPAASIPPARDECVVPLPLTAAGPRTPTPTPPTPTPTLPTLGPFVVMAGTVTCVGAAGACACICPLVRAIDGGVGIGTATAGAGVGCALILADPLGTVMPCGREREGTVVRPDAPKLVSACARGSGGGAG